ncbi:MAG TPA: hypothetical protein VJG83_06915 [archaeon]|nr:hypothetical protein [archaeon]
MPQPAGNPLRRERQVARQARKPNDLATALKAISILRFRNRLASENYPLWRMRIEKRNAQEIINIAISRCKLRKVEEINKLMLLLTRRINSRNYNFIKSAQPEDIHLTGEEKSLAKSIGPEKLFKTLTEMDNINTAMSKHLDVRSIGNTFPQHAMVWGARHANLILRAAFRESF